MLLAILPETSPKLFREFGVGPSASVAASVVLYPNGCSLTVADVAQLAIETSVLLRLKYNIDYTMVLYSL